MFSKGRKEKSPLVDFYGNDHRAEWPPSGSKIPNLKGFSDTEKKPNTGEKGKTSTSGW